MKGVVLEGFRMYTQGRGKIPGLARINAADARDIEISFAVAGVRDVYGGLKAARDYRRFLPGIVLPKR
jgi:hypothetical protein